MTTNPARPFRIGLALDGAGWHPAAWRRSPVTEPATLFSGRYWADWGRASAAGGIGFVTLEDGLTAQTEQFGAVPADAESRVRGRLDPVVAAAVLLSASDVEEVVVTRNVTHANPFHVATQLASLSAIGPGRVVWRPQVSANARDATAVGGTPTPELRPDDIYVPTRIARRLRDLFRDAETFVRSVRDLWTTFPADGLGSGDTFWQPSRVGALPGPAPAAGPLNVPVFSVPPVAALAHHAVEPYRLAAAVADRVFVTPTGDQPLSVVLPAFREIEKLTPDATATEVYADLAVILGDTDEHARDRHAELDRTAGARWTTDTGVFTGSPVRLAEVLARWRDEHGLAGARLRPAVLPDDAERIIRDVVPLLA
ncbi:LLM class flavin-dependent oxidoreductase [Amycolatopsis australiensis]|uniref:Flavin-dependent oxidoreductase, luciferase family (Includes alkanesulfonate monooxygenase SsuD and methylene tetrahydromethanopterin reductase) n=1 Tax=Amycolatopsis australiensis TaxID=546364 RepID=A0A1K1S3Z0_9PSEU|nr:LLM class flavin-dependent oxidoreductase [Amycolatopsis australiensis]SFW78780.1 Flavin-dependent oxidoreductase, luciferase family (includes alkanesulfonate monooxygenase SsuD and methylene tetrahydromethanopterin reductase) [Amycolatopsis australiensis]